MRLPRLLLVALCGISACQQPPSEQERYDRAFLLFRQGELAAASGLVRQRPRTSAPDLYFKWRLLEAEIATQTNQPQAALALLSEPIPFPDLDARRQVDRCVIWSANPASLPSAQESLEAARRFITAATPADTRLAGDLCQAVIFITARRLPEAETILRRLAEEARNASPYYRAAALGTLVHTSVLGARFDVAAQYGEQAVAAAEKVRAKRIYAASATNLATTYNVLGDFDSALPLLSRATAIASEIGIPYWLQNALGEQGNSFYYLGNYVEAARFYADAYSIAKEQGVGEPGKWAGNLATALIEAGRLDEAETWNARAMERARDDPYLQSNSAEIWKLRGDSERALFENRKAMQSARRNPELSRSLHAQLASILLARGNFPAAQREYEQTLDLIERDRRVLSRNSFRIGFLARLIGHYQNYVAALVARKDFGAALEVAERSRARTMADRLGRSARSSSFDARNLARSSGSVLVSYWLAPAESYVWIVTPGQIQLEKLPPRQEIDRIVQSYRKTVEESLRDPLTDDAGKIFYEQIVRPAAKHIDRGSRVILVPDGSLHQVNLESAPVPGEPPYYWLQDVTISIAPSLALLDPAAPFQGVSPALLFGAPETVDPRYPALPNADDEIASIHRILSGAQIVTRERAAANPAAFFDSSPERFSIIHFAAHGESSRESPLESAVVLSQSDRGFKLYAREIVEIPLRARLVTISGCRSAGSRSYSGEGLIGFAWAFLQAGAESVIAALWEVGDKSTADLMSDMYKELASGATPADSLRAAKISMIRKGRWKHPRDWAPFQTYIRAVHVAKKASPI